MARIYDILNTAPTDGQVLTYDDTLKQWKPANTAAGVTAAEGVSLSGTEVQLGHAASGTGASNFTANRYLYTDIYDLETRGTGGFTYFDGSTGNFGVNEAVPAVDFHVTSALANVAALIENTNAAGRGAIAYRGSGGSVGLIIGVESADAEAYYGSFNSKPHDFFSDNVFLQRLDTNGDVWFSRSAATASVSMVHYDQSKASFYGGSSATVTDISGIGQYSFNWGRDNNISGNHSDGSGRDNTASSDMSTVRGLANTANSYAQTVLGINATVATGQTGTSWVATDEIFKVGIGATTAARADGIVIYKNGVTQLGEYGVGVMEIGDANMGAKVASVYGAGFATDGTLIEVIGGITPADEGLSKNATTGAIELGTTTQNDADQAFSADRYINLNASALELESTNGDNFPTARFESGGDVWFGADAAVINVPLLHFDKSINSLYVGQSSTLTDITTRGLHSASFGVNNTISGDGAMSWGLSNNAITGTYATAWGFGTTASGSQATTWGIGSAASANYSTAWGNGNTASGELSTALGYGNVASGFSSMVWGSNNPGTGNTASGSASTAWGLNNIASGEKSTAFGESNTASGFESTAIGNSSVSDGNYSFSAGIETRALGYGSFSMGHYPIIPVGQTNNSIVATDELFTIGNGNSTTRSNSLVGYKNGVWEMSQYGVGVMEIGDANMPTQVASVYGAGFATDGTIIEVVGGITPANNGVSKDATTGAIQLGHDAVGSGASDLTKNRFMYANGFDITISNASNNVTNAPTMKLAANGDVWFGSGDTTNAAANGHIFYDKSKTLFSGGVRTAALSNAGGLGSFQWGNQSSATGSWSLAFGLSTVASGNYSKAWGDTNTASGLYSTAWGEDTNSTAQASTTFGRNTTASGNYATASGDGTTASGNSATSIGGATIALGNFSFASGATTQANGIASATFGSTTIASGNYSIAAGLGTLASGLQSFAWGEATTASSTYSTAWGSNTTASGSVSTAFGSTTVASGTNSVAFGTLNTASGVKSTAFGDTNTATADLATVWGFENDANSFRTTVLGSFSKLAAGQSLTTWVVTDELFKIGNGTAAGSESNSLVGYKNGVWEMSQYGQGVMEIGDANMPTQVASVYGAGFATDGTIIEVVGGITPADEGLSKNATTGAIELGTTTQNDAAQAFTQDRYINLNSQSLEFESQNGDNEPTMRLQNQGDVYFGADNIANAEGGLTTLFFDKSKGSLYAGLPTANSLSTIGAYSFGFGANLIPSGDFSAAFGLNGVASATGSMTWGRGGTASASYATAFGDANTASGLYAIAAGLNSTASGNQSVAIGSSLTASAENATAFGIENTSSSYGSTTFGVNSIVPTGQSATTFVNGDELFKIGNGVNTGARSNSLVGYKNGVWEMSQYGQGTKEAADLTKVESDYIATFATDGTVLEKYRLVKDYTDDILVGDVTNWTVDDGNPIHYISVTGANRTVNSINTAGVADGTVITFHVINNGTNRKVTFVSGGAQGTIQNNSVDIDVQEGGAITLQYRDLVGWFAIGN